MDAPLCSGARGIVVLAAYLSVSQEGLSPVSKYFLKYLGNGYSIWDLGFSVTHSIRRSRAASAVAKMSGGRRNYDLGL
jgi:hypothetical protein